ncbi:prolyl-tRNA editing enzyme YbaK/EbsC (Cys-tRNA(Pro) deacylase) [Rhodopseudomonas julia]|uniref:Prolyl-tRNA editing enzyme YbaK/EbsC (Cys-tRNA(Pro) deacylase) n=1 Tax=Rhodopseudomonas julia TaxID=200617 RepID=A0ABU0CBH5_9BRAD|nr:YbaK/EbsC family protein [Rhodopseudomonas julia]MDQ0327542.1 prolyl-tRNA editing enzyme YbaK/EbsC (Cys-tRNA(Pro) deacylase) [Rhodopseudomonas julia]
MASTARSSDRVAAAARAAGIDISIERMPDTTRTAEDAARACGTSVAQIVKSLIFKKAESGEPVLLLVSGKNRVNEKKMAERLGEVLERVDARTVRDLTGFAIGGVAPLGSTSPLATYIDEDLLAFDSVWAAAGAPNAVFEIEPNKLKEATGAEAIRMD